MLCELRVRQLGVIEDLSLVFGPGMTALTGETGAGKTLLVEAVELLVGGRADGMLVRPGAAEATVEGRFAVPVNGSATQARPSTRAEMSDEVVISRVVPAEGRSRAYLDGRMASTTALAELGEVLVDLHGQHSQQSLLASAAQREALDAYAGADRQPRDVAREQLRAIEGAVAAAGGSALERQRELRLVEFQLAELEAAQLGAPDEDYGLADLERSLAHAAEDRAAAIFGYQALVGEDQLLDNLGELVSRTAGRPALAVEHERLRSLQADLNDVAADLRNKSEALEEDPERLAEVTARRAKLADLRRKYGGPGGDMGPVIAFYEHARERLAELRDYEATAERLGAELAAAVARLRRASTELGAARRAAAAGLGRAVESELRALAMPRARFEVVVAGTPGDTPATPGGALAAELAELAGEDVTFLLAANPGEPLLPLAKVASGGELARAMLALRLVIMRHAGHDREAQLDAGDRRTGAEARPAGPATLVFDEVDAGVGGEAAVAVGEALAALGRHYQVLVVTHLAQVAACADAQVAVSKSEIGGRAVAKAELVEGDRRVIELSRMLSGQPASATARRHAQELLGQRRRSAPSKAG
ncbi:MAG TPA: DNA repair protein RecN [Acidimicrobiales bacterium]|nr:DNA repair protein RecN [Acidimicrobiales bacterium]